MNSVQNNLINNTVTEQKQILSNKDKLQLQQINSELCKELVDLNLSITSINHLATQTQQFSEEFNDFIRFEWIEYIQSVFKNHVSDRALKKIENEHWDENIVEWLVEYKVFGWLIRVSTPIPTKSRSGEYITHSWNYTQSNWFYAETYDLALAEAKKWVKKFWEEKINEALKG